MEAVWQSILLLTLKDCGLGLAGDGWCLARSQIVIETSIPTTLQVRLFSGYNFPTSAKILWEQTRCPTRRIHPERIEEVIAAC